MSKKQRYNEDYDAGSVDDDDDGVIVVDCAQTSCNKNRKKFRNQWMENPIFKKWLRPYSGNNEKAYCAACECVLVVGLSELNKHATSMKHEKSMKELAKREKSVSDKWDEEVVSEDSNNRRDFQIMETEESENNSEDDDNFDDDLENDESDVEDDDDDDDKSSEEENFDENESSDYQFMKSCPVVSELAPFWKSSALVNGHITELTLPDYRGHFLILFFYAQDFSKSGTADIIKISDSMSTFRDLNTEVVACSVDSCFAHRAWARLSREDGGIAPVRIPLLSDPTHTISQSYGCFVPDLGHPLNAYFIIDKKGILRHATVNDHYVPCSVESMLKTLISIQKEGK